MIQKIIINFPTNLGDTILALPVLDELKAAYPEAQFTAIVSPRTKDFLLRNNFIDEVALFDKSWRTRQKWGFVTSLGGKFDLFVDLKNSFLPVILRAKLRTPFIRSFPKNTHITDKYLALIRRFTPLENSLTGFTRPREALKSNFILSDDEKNRWESLRISRSVFIACSSRSVVKGYPYECLKEVVQILGEEVPLVILGTEADRDFYKDILSSDKVYDLVGKTRMIDAFYLLKNYARLLLGVDSSILHLASYLNVPAVSIFGPTHPGRSYPKSANSIVLTNKNAACAPCEKPTCKFDYECMKVEPSEVVEAIRQILNKVASRE